MMNIWQSAGNMPGLHCRWCCAFVSSYHIAGHYVKSVDDGDFRPPGGSCYSSAPLLGSGANIMHCGMICFEPFAVVW